MHSLQIIEGLIGTACAVACLYYARQGSLAGVPRSSPQAAAPWHSALGEYARKNPFAAVFGALAFGFLASSWMMYASPRAIALPPRTIEKWHTIIRNVSTPDPALAERIATLQTTINTDTATIASQKTEIDRLKRLLGKSALESNNTRHRIRPSAAAGSADAAFRPSEAKENPIAPGGTAAGSNTRPNPASAAPEANTGAAANPPPSQSGQTNVTAPTNGTVNAPGSVENSNPAPPNSASTVPH